MRLWDGAWDVWGAGGLGSAAPHNRDKKCALGALARDIFARRLAWIADERGYKPGWTAHKYKEKFNT